MEYHKLPESVENDSYAESVQLLTAHQLDIYFYVRSLVLDPNDVAEIVQETNLVLWQKRGEFKTIQNFRAWAFQIARNIVLKQQSKRKNKFLSFSNALIDELAVKATEFSAISEELLDGLNRCVALLSAEDREILRQRYGVAANCEDIAKSIGRPIRWVYKALNRIRRQLYDCIKHQTADGGDR